jgi:hypothetical protein
MTVEELARCKSLDAIGNADADMMQGSDTMGARADVSTSNQAQDLSV